VVDPFEFVPHDPASGICPFKWILMEAARIRALRQHQNATIYQVQRDMDMAWRKPIWKALDAQLTDREEDRRTTGRRNRK
jgi:hypothetical protein